MRRSIPALITLSSLLAFGAQAQTTTTQKKKTKKTKTKKVAKRKTVTKRKAVKKISINPMTGKPADLTYTLYAGYENNTFKNINVTSGDATEKLKTKGVYAALGIETSLNENISTTTTPSASITSQNRSTYDGVGTNEYKATTLKVAQALNMNFETGMGAIIQPFVEGALGYGFISHQLSAQDATNSYSSSLDVEGYLYEVSAGVNLRFQNGLVPFAKIGVRKFQVNGESNNNAALNSALANEQSIDSQTDFSSASAVFGLGFQF